jgi:hypothetical protein
MPARPTATRTPSARSKGRLRDRQLPKTPAVLSVKRFRAYAFLWRLVMKRTSLVVLILCASFASVAWGHQPAGQVQQQLERVAQDEHGALEPM